MQLLPDELAGAYLDHLGVDARAGEVDAATLTSLQRAHVTRVPYENIDIYRGSPPGIEPTASIERILGGRGGYCYHLNGALIFLLEWLGADVTGHVSGVQGGTISAPNLSGNHLGVTVRTPDGQEWMVDAGFGDGPAEPLPLEVGAYELDGFTYEIRDSAIAPGGWRFEHDPRLSFTGADFARAPADVTGSFVEMHVELTTSPTSGFVRTATASRTVDGGFEVLRGCVHSVNRGGVVESQDVESCDEWWGVVIDGFGLAYGDIPREERIAIWERVRASHESWVAAGRGR